MREVRPTWTRHNWWKMMVNFSTRHEETLMWEQTGSKLKNWTERRVSSESRCMIFVQTIKERHRPLKQMALPVSFAFAIPRSSTEVKRLFSETNDVKTPHRPYEVENPQSEAQRHCKFQHIDCSQYYKSVKNNKPLLMSRENRNIRNNHRRQMLEKKVMLQRKKTTFRWLRLSKNSETFGSNTRKVDVVNKNWRKF